jgi:hypothetical protein
VQAKAPIKVTLKVDQKALIEDARSKAVALASIKVANALPLTGMIAATTDAPPATRILRWTPATNNCRPQPRARTMGACACPSS